MREVAPRATLASALLESEADLGLVISRPMLMSESAVSASGASASPEELVAKAFLFGHGDGG